MSERRKRGAMDTPDQAEALISDLSARAHTPEARGQHQRSLEIIKVLMPYAWGLSAGTRCGFGELIDRIRQPDELAETARRAFLSVVPYLAGDRGPFDMVFLYQGSPVNDVSFEGDAMLIRDDAGRSLPLKEVILVLERRAGGEEVQCP